MTLVETIVPNALAILAAGAGSAAAIEAYRTRRSVADHERALYGDGETWEGAVQVARRNREILEEEVQDGT